MYLCHKTSEVIFTKLTIIIIILPPPIKQGKRTIFLFWSTGNQWNKQIHVIVLWNSSFFHRTRNALKRYTLAYVPRELFEICLDTKRKHLSLYVPAKQYSVRACIIYNSGWRLGPLRRQFTQWISTTLNFSCELVIGITNTITCFKG